MVEPQDSAKAFTEPLNIERTQQLPVPAPAPKSSSSTTPTEEASSSKRKAEAPSRKKMLIPAAAGVALLLLGGGYLMWSGSSETTRKEPVASETPPVIVNAPPAPTPPAPTPTPVAENPSGDTPPTQPETPAAETAKPTEVAAVTPSVSPNASPQPSETPPGRDGKKLPGSKPRGMAPPGPKASTSKLAGKGTLAFRVRPFATVFINGKSQGQTPFDPVELPVGTYSVRFVNDDLKKNVTQTVELKAGENKVIKLNLEE